MPKSVQFQGHYDGLLTPRVIFLSAGLPVSPPFGMAREAVIYLARFAFARGFQIITRADPVVVLPLLAEAVHFAPPAGGVVAFDDGGAPMDQLDMGRWSRGVLVRTSPQYALGAVLLGAPLSAIVFVGGAGRSYEDYLAWHAGPRTEPIYPIGSTGGDAGLLLSQGAAVGRNRQSDLRRTLEEVQSYPLVMSRIFEDIGTP